MALISAGQMALKRSLRVNDGGCGSLLLLLLLLLEERPVLKAAAT